MRVLETADQHLRIVKDMIHEAEQKLKEMRKEQDKLSTEMRVKDIADYLGYTDRTIYRMLEDGRLKSRKMIDVLEAKQ